MTENRLILSILLGLGLIIGGGVYIGSLVMTPSFFPGSSANAQQEPGYKEFDIVLQNNVYYPSTITVDLGDRVVLNITNRDQGAHAVELPEFNATVPGGHVFPGQTVRMEFLATKKGSSDAATCGGPIPTSDHGEKLMVNVI